MATHDRIIVRNARLLECSLGNSQTTLDPVGREQTMAISLRRAWSDSDEARYHDLVEVDEE